MRTLAFTLSCSRTRIHTGARVSLYEHSLQTATRALRAGEDEETVVVALLHDIGELMSPSSHGTSFSPSTYTT
jgi:predicted HD phosphohydrolase